MCNQYTMKPIHCILLIIAIPFADAYFIQNQNKKICADCKFFNPNKKQCIQFGEADIITGKRIYESAADVRKDETKCGQSAVLFQKNNFKVITIPYYFVSEYWPVLAYTSFVVWAYYSINH